MSVRILTGDCLDLMPTLDAESVDAIVCDPPYGLGFMGKAWDHGVPGVPFWEAALRVAKPGAHLVAFGGTRTYHRLTCAIEDAGWEIRDCLSWLYGSGFPKSHNGPWGGTALKPAWEPIILARKPLAATVAENVAEYGTGALNIDGCRIGSEAITVNGWRNAPGNADMMERIADKEYRGGTHAGRWPANVVLDEDAAAMLDEQTGELTSGAPGVHRLGVNTGSALGAESRTPGTPMNCIGDSGGASRFFYTAKASRSERNAGLGSFADRRVVHQAQTLNNGSGGLRNGDGLPTATKNHHPTVKPLDLMRWLCRLITPPGGTILDHFAGSGSTGCAAELEGFDSILIEREAEYVEIIRARVAHHASLYVPQLDLGGAA